MRGVLHYMQRTALQGSPTTLMHVTNEFTPGAERTTDAGQAYAQSPKTERGPYRGGLPER